jgi:N-acetylneuraminate synthase
MKCKIIAEIGCNHKGDLNIAKEMIQVAAQVCKVDIVKFQKRTPKELLTEEEYNKPHPVEYNSYGKTYGEHREALEFTREQHAELKAECEKYGVIYSCSVWDITAADEIISLCPEIIKIPSACNTDFKLLQHVCQFYDGEIHISHGMTTWEERQKIYAYVVGAGRKSVHYLCTSDYPVGYENINLLEMENYNAFSGHHNGIAADVAARVLGAEYIERHFTLNRTWKGTDHAASLEPDGMRKLVRDIRAVEMALTYKEKDILDCEIEQRKKLKRFSEI